MISSTAEPFSQRKRLAPVQGGMLAGNGCFMRGFNAFCRDYEQLPKEIVVMAFHGASCRCDRNASLGDEVHLK